MELLFLGTGGGVPSKRRNVTSMALIMPEKEGAMWLFDCGEATQHQILETKVKLPKIEAIFITHLHGDHIYGLPGVLGSRSFQGATKPLHVYGPKGIKAFINIALTTSETYLRYDLKIHEIEEGICFEDDFFVIETRLLEHGIPSYGYRIREKDQPGQLLVDKLKNRGIMPGPIYSDIKHNESVTLSDGTVLRREEFLGADKRGRIITILGDTRPCVAALKLGEKATLLVHDSTFEKGMEELAHDYFHSTSEDAAKIAKAANAAALILTHFSSRYQEEGDIDQLLSEAKAIFPNTFAADDLWSFDIPYQPR